MRPPTPLFVALYISRVSNGEAAQTVDIIRKSEFQPSIHEKDFAFIEPVTDSTGFTLIATLKATGSDKKGGIDVLYHTLKNKAQELGANCFKLSSYSRQDSTGTGTGLDWGAALYHPEWSVCHSIPGGLISLKATWAIC